MENVEADIEINATEIINEPQTHNDNLITETHNDNLITETPIFENDIPDIEHNLEIQSIDEPLNLIVVKNVNIIDLTSGPLDLRMK